MISEFVVTYRLPLLTVFVFFLVLAGYGLTRLEVNPNNRVFFGETDDHYQDLLEFEAEFDSNTKILFAISTPEALFQNSDSAEAIRWLSDQAWLLPRVVRVDSLQTYPHVQADEDGLLVEPLLEHVCPESGCQEAKSSLLQKPQFINRFLSRDFKTVAVIATVDFDMNDAQAVSVIQLEAENLASMFKKVFPNLEIHYTGGVPMMQAFVDAANKDVSTLVLMAGLVLAALLFLFLGGLMPMLFMLGLGVSSIIISMGMAGWSGHVVNTATATVPLIVLTLVIASSMHVFLHIVRETQLHTSEQVRACVRSAIESNWEPVLLTAITSIVGLLSMTFVSSPPIQQLGLWSAIGVATGAILTLTVVPAALSYLEHIRPSIVLQRVQQLLNNYSRRLEVDSVSRMPVYLLFSVMSLGVVGLVVDEDFVRYFDTDGSFRSNAEAITEKLASPYHIEVVVDSLKSEGVFDADSVAAVRKVTKFLREHPLVANVFSITDVFDEVVTAFGSKPGLVPPDELAQYFLSFELSLSQGQSTTDFVDMNHRKSRISVLLRDCSMKDIRELDEEIRSWIAREFSGPLEIKVTGEGVPTAYLSSDSISEVTIGIVLSLVFSSVLLGIVFRQLRIAVAILSATVIPIVCGFGVWGWTVGTIGMAATLVIAVTIGVVIDDSIHLVYRFRDGLRRLDLTTWGAAAYSVHRTGAAIVTTSIVLAGGFGVLLLSGFRMNSTFGICTALVILLALIFNLIIMPRILVWAVTPEEGSRS